MGQDKKTRKMDIKTSTVCDMCEEDHRREPDLREGREVR